MSSTKPPIRVSVLFEGTQLSDLIGLDLLGNPTPQTINLIVAMNPDFACLASHAIPMSFVYISSSTEPAHVTPDMYVHACRTTRRSASLTFSIFLMLCT
jgi:hypothetical protein